MGKIEPRKPLTQGTLYTLACFSDCTHLGRCAKTASSRHPTCPGGRHKPRCTGYIGRLIVPGLSQKYYRPLELRQDSFNYGDFRSLNVVEMTFPPTLVEQIRRAPRDSGQEGRPTFGTGPLFQRRPRQPHRMHRGGLARQTDWDRRSRAGTSVDGMLFQ
jgi:hypothetical protein